MCVVSLIPIPRKWKGVTARSCKTGSMPTKPNPQWDRMKTSFIHWPSVENSDQLAKCLGRTIATPRLFLFNTTTFLVRLRVLADANWIPPTSAGIVVGNLDATIIFQTIVVKTKTCALSDTDCYIKTHRLVVTCSHVITDVLFFRCRFYLLSAL